MSRHPRGKATPIQSGKLDADPTVITVGTSRLYQTLARRLLVELGSGNYRVGDRLPTERELCLEHGVSRPTVREAMIALEVQGFLEVRVGSGAYVLRIPGAEDKPGFDVTAFELTEARMLFEGEAAALAVSHIEEETLAELDRLVIEIGDQNQDPDASEAADRRFHLLIASATCNMAVSRGVEELWRLRATSPECVLLHKKARGANVRPVAEEHREIVLALREGDPSKARAAMRRHLTAVLDYLLFATEQQAIEEVRRSTEKARARFTRLAAT
jgi:GntR family transcriptional repressor for pyruvate dehydrogenase complex